MMNSSDLRLRSTIADTQSQMSAMHNGTVYEIPAPMLAKAVPAIPDPAKTAGGLSFEPKWDGFRALIAFDGTGPDGVEIGSRGAKPLTRYFPELVAAFAALLPEPCLIDGEIVVALAAGAGGGGERLSWEALSQRIHPAASRVALLSETTPARFIAFDLLARGDNHSPRCLSRQSLECFFPLHRPGSPAHAVTQRRG